MSKQTYVLNNVSGKFEFHFGAKPYFVGSFGSLSAHLPDTALGNGEFAPLFASAVERNWRCSQMLVLF